jgi:hypothetical protein
MTRVAQNRILAETGWRSRYDFRHCELPVVYGITGIANCQRHTIVCRLVDITPEIHRLLFDVQTSQTVHHRPKESGMGRAQHV